ncbi:MAG: glycosyltransferase [Streptococcaceae bacterium]|jgi:glycosyltransferase involved in cell wall biosynthesis|nr:glycosyltransferase [Streptococcaceae bacterium]
MKLLTQLAKIILFWNVRRAREEKDSKTLIAQMAATNPPQPLVSVLVPVFNVAPYLEACLESLLAQDYPNLEIVCVDDASTDGSREILSRFSDRLTILTKSVNEGLPQARKTALEQAKGDFILNVDADDTLVPSAVSDMVLTAQASHADVVVCDYEKSGEIIRQPKIPETGSFRRVQTRSFAYGNTIWNRLILRSLALELDFPYANAGEDIVLNTGLYLKAKKIVHCHKALYHWRKTTGSMTNTVREETYKELDKNYARVWALCEAAFNANELAKIRPLYKARQKRIQKRGWS